MTVHNHIQPGQNRGPDRTARPSPAPIPSAPRTLRPFRLLLFLLIAASAGAFLAFSIHWPLVGDSAQIHYICFLLDHGMPPYRVAQDMNMPGAILLEWTVMHTLGAGSLAWRLFDLLTVAAGTVSMAVIAGRNRRLAGIAAGLLLLLLHGADGLNDTGERDLSMAVFLLLAYAAFFALLRRLDPATDPPRPPNARLKARPKKGERTGLILSEAKDLPFQQPWPRHILSAIAATPGDAVLAFAFGLTAAAAATIKPTALPLVLLLFAVLALRLTTHANPPVPQAYSPARLLTAALAGLALPFAAVLAFLLQQQALAAFLHDLFTVVPFYAALDHRPLGYLLLHSVAPLLPVVLCWVAFCTLSLKSGPRPAGAARYSPFNFRFDLRSAVRSSPAPSIERILLLLGAFFGLLSYLVQAKGFPYYRYPLLAFLLPLMAVDFDRVLATHPTRQDNPRGLARAAIAVLALLYACAWLAPLSAWRAHAFRPRDQQFIHSLSRDLQSLHARDRQVQCIDSISGCGNTLLRLRLVQTTGLLSDFFIFSMSPGRLEVPAVQQARARFQSAVARQPPRYLVITDRLHLNPRDPGNWSKLQTWAWFDHWLAARYTLVLTREPTRLALWWSRPQWPAAYKIYVRNPDAAHARAQLAQAAGMPTQSKAPLALFEP